MKKLLLLVGMCWGLMGCVAGQHVKLNHIPSSVAQETRIAINIEVKDQRDAVVKGHWGRDRIGAYRAGFGNKWDVTTFKNRALADLIKEDLSEDARSLGYQVVENGQEQKWLRVAITTWDFDGYIDTRFWYAFTIEVLNHAGEVLAKDAIEGEKIMHGNAMTGAKSGVQRDLPKIYSGLIEDLLRNNIKIRKSIDS